MNYFQILGDKVECVFYKRTYVNNNAGETSILFMQVDRLRVIDIDHKDCTSCSFGYAQQFVMSY